VLKVKEYSAIETLRDGCRVEIRALRPDDRADLIAAVSRASDRSLYRRFFGLKRSFTDQEAAFFVNVDFVNHVALIALIDEDGRSVIAGGGRYIVVQPGQAEIAFVVVDEYQRRGIGRALMRHLTNIARAAGLGTLIAEVLPENTPMLQLFKTSGLQLSTRREDQVVDVTIWLSDRRD
jgi:ribosomal protein S18 acetylase RimI-like enzyme